MIRIFSDGEALISEDLNWYDVTDIGWLVQQRHGESFVLCEDRLWEADEGSVQQAMIMFGKK